jgi:hypothetical protein
MSPEFDSLSHHSVFPIHFTGKYISFEEPICSRAILFILANKDSNAMDHLEGKSLFSLFPKKWKLKIKNKINIEYKAKLVKVNVK